MKNLNKLFIISFLGLFISFSSFANEEFPEVYNQNYHVAKYLKENNFDIGYLTPKNGTTSTIRFNYGNYKLTIIKLDELDVNGYNNYHLKFYSSKLDHEIILVPENNFYPLTYVVISYPDNATYENKLMIKLEAKSSPNRKFDLPNHYLKDVIIMNGGLLLQAEIKLDRIQGQFRTKPSKLVMYPLVENYHGFINDKSNSNGEFKNSDNWIEKMDIIDKEKMEKENRQKKKPTWVNDDFKEYKGAKYLYLGAVKYFDDLNKKAKEKTYDELISEYKDGLYHYYYQGEYTIGGRTSYKGTWTEYIKLKFEKNEKNVVEKIIIQFTHTDLEFYEKEKFFKTFTKDKSNKFVTDDGWVIYPFGKRLLLRAIDNKYSTYRFRIISPYKYDHHGYNIVNLYGKVSRTDMSEEWWCKENLESKYDAEKDPNDSKNLFKKYLENFK